MPICQSCGERNPDHARFCLGCGRSLAVVGAAADVRKVVTVLFCDVSGSTEMGERLDAESIREVMTRYFERARETIERHGGTVEKFIGDAVMAVFGIPRAHGDDPVRAVRAAVALLGVVEEIESELMARWNVGFRVRIGVHTGEVVAGDPSAGQAFVAGDTANTAARLEQAAPPGKILIGQTTRQLLGDAALTEQVEPLTLKGKARPVPAFLVLGLAGPPRATTRQPRIVLHGRERELQVLDRALFRARSGEGSAILIRGEAGMGKTALVERFLTNVGHGADVIAVRCDPPEEGGAASDPIRQSLERIVGEPLARDTEAIARKVEDVAPGSERVPVIARGLARAMGIDEEGTGEEARWATGVFVAAAARIHPIVLWFDDVERAAPSDREAIADLVGALKEASVVAIACERTGVADISALPVDDVIDLPPLAPPEVAAILAETVGGPIDPSLADRLADASGGNPLFAQESAALVLGSADGAGDALAREEGGGPRVPLTVRSLLEARLDALAPDERIFVEALAIAGSAEPAAISAVVPPELRPAAKEILERVLAKGVLVLNEGRFRFRHGLFREVAYDDLTKRRRAELHAAYGRWLEAGPAPELDPEPIAYHLGRAVSLWAELAQPPPAGGLAEEAGSWWVRVGQTRVRSGDLDRAGWALDRATEALQHGPRDTPSARDAGLFAARLGRWDLAIELLERFDRSDDAQARKALGLSLTKRFRNEPGREAYRRGQMLLSEVAASSEDPDAVATLAGTWRGIDEERARTLYREAVRLDPSAPYALGNHLEYELLEARDPAPLEHLRHALKGALARRRAQALSGEDLPWSFFDLGKFSLLEGDVDASLSAYAKAVQLSSAEYMIGSSRNSINRLAGALPGLEGIDLAAWLLALGAEARFPLAGREEVKHRPIATEPFREPVVVLAGSSDRPVPAKIRAAVLAATAEFAGTVISGGTAQGVGALAGDIREQRPGAIDVIGYLPTAVPTGTAVEAVPRRYRELRRTDGSAFGVVEPLQYWTDLLAMGVQPRAVRILGIGGGSVAALEYRLALALGADVAVLRGSGRSASALLADPGWAASGRLQELPIDAHVLRVFILGSRPASR